MGFFKGLGSVVTAPPRALWDLVTVDDEERARHEEKRRQKMLEEYNAPDPERYGPTSGQSDRDMRKEVDRRWAILKKAEELGVEPGIAIEAAMLDERKRENTLATMRTMNELARTEKMDEAREMAELMKFLEIRAQQRPPRQLPQSSDVPMVRMAQRSY